MEDKPRVWHYGLIAETWSEFSADTPELPFLEKQIESYGLVIIRDSHLRVGVICVLLRSRTLSAGINVVGPDG